MKEPPDLGSGLSQFLTTAVNVIKPPFMKLIVVLAAIALTAFAYIRRESAADYLILMFLLLILFAFLAFASEYSERHLRYTEKTEERLKDAIRVLTDERQLLTPAAQVNSVARPIGLSPEQQLLLLETATLLQSLGAITAIPNDLVHKADAVTLAANQEAIRLQFDALKTHWRILNMREWDKARYGGRVPKATINEIAHTEKALADTGSKLKKLLEQAYGGPIA